MLSLYMKRWMIGATIKRLIEKKYEKNSLDTQMHSLIKRLHENELDVLSYEAQTAKPFALGRFEELEK